MRDIPEQVMAMLEHAAGPAVAADDQLARLLLTLRLWAGYYLVALGDSTARAIAGPLSARNWMWNGRAWPRRKGAHR